MVTDVGFSNLSLRKIRKKSVGYSSKRLSKCALDVTARAQVLKNLIAWRWCSMPRSVGLLPGNESYNAETYSNNLFEQAQQIGQQEWSGKRSEKTCQPHCQTGECACVAIHLKSCGGADAMSG